MKGKHGTEAGNFVTSFVECQGKVLYEVLNLQFDTSRLERETADEFWSMMRTFASRFPSGPRIFVLTSLDSMTIIWNERMPLEPFL